MCAAKNCENDAFLFEADGTIGLCYPHWRSLWTKTNFYDDSGWAGVPVDLKDGRRLRMEGREAGIVVESLSYRGPHAEEAKGD